MRTIMPDVDTIRAQFPPGSDQRLDPEQAPPTLELCATGEPLIFRMLDPAASTGGSRSGPASVRSFLSPMGRVAAQRPAKRSRQKSNGMGSRNIPSRGLPRPGLTLRSGRSELAAKAGL